MSRPTIRLIVPEAPFYVEACATQVHSVGLGQSPEGSPHRVFLVLAPPEEPERATLIHVSLDDARFLRDAIDTVFERHHATQQNAN
jgi:hypothetical protein